MEILHGTLKDFFKSINLPLSQDFEMTVHRLKGLHGDKSMASPLFRSDYYSFLLITNGQSSYTIDGQAFELSNGSFYFTNPGHLKSFNIEIPIEGFLLTFSEGFLKENFIGDFFQMFPFLVHESTPVMRLDKAKMTEINDFFETVLQEYNNTGAYKKAILSNQLTILLYKTKELLLSNKVVIKSQSRNGELLSQFKNVLNDNFKALASGKAEKIWSIKEIADQLNVHPNYLSNVVKTESGKSASEWIQERTLAEAKAFLLQSSKTISEIAYVLGFTDSTHFAKFFKKMEGKSPTDFRKSLSL
jgi:AraC family transcriptional regulator, transcriptional activator of pobA